MGSGRGVSVGPEEALLAAAATVALAFAVALALAVAAAVPGVTGCPFADPAGAPAATEVREAAVLGWTGDTTDAGSALTPWR